MSASPLPHAIEHERLWSKVWLLVAHESELPAAGDRVSHEVGARSWLIVRDTTGDVRAFHNVCPHRGTLLCAGRHESASSVRCPYHHWEFALSGELLAAPGAGSAAEGASLFPLRCERRAGFVFVTADPDPPSLDEFLGPLGPELETLAGPGWTLQGDRTYPLDCNWKTSVDVHNESYHLPTLHPQLASYVDIASITWAPLGRHGTHHIPVRGPNGQVIKRQLFIFPNTQLNFTEDRLELYRHRPHPSDPAKCFFDEQELTKGGQARARVGHTIADPRSASPTSALAQDLHIAERLERGLSTGALSRPRWTEHERAVAHFHHTLSEYLDPR